MHIEVISKDPNSIRMTLTGAEIFHLKMALERATFLDTPPQHQRAIYNFASDLLQNLEPLLQESEN